VRIVLMLFAITAGALQPLQAAVNSQFAQRGATVLWAASISGAITSLTLAAAALLVWRAPPPSLGSFASVPPLLWTGGVLGAVILGMMTVVAPRLGVALMFVCFLAGIIVCSLLLDQFGVLGLPQQPLTLGRAVGAGLVIAAVLLVRFS
jgi:bacterial/archaeal transporter family-2 protein